MPIKGLFYNDLRTIDLKSKTLKSSIELLNQFIDDLEKYPSTYVTNENILAAAKRTFVNLSDYIANIIVNIKKTLFSSNIKSEFQYWLNDNNSSTINNIYNLNLNEIKDTIIDIPTGMTTTYMKSTTLLIDNLISYDIENKVNFVINILTNIEQHINTSDFTKAINILNNTKLSFNVTQIEKNHNSVLNLFKGKKKTTTFIEAFKNIQEFKDVGDLLIANSKLYNVSDLDVKLQELSFRINNIIQKIKTDDTANNLSKSDIENLAYIIRNLAISFNYYGVELLLLNSIEHTYCKIMENFKGYIVT